MTWTPASRELDPLTIIVRRAVLGHLFPDGGSAPPAAGGRWRETRLSDGRVVRADLDAKPALRRQRDARTCAEIRVTGALALDGAGYRIEADVVIDIATRAVLSCETRHEAVGP